MSAGYRNLDRQARSFLLFRLVRLDHVCWNRDDDWLALSRPGSDHHADRPFLLQIVRQQSRIRVFA